MNDIEVSSIDLVEGGNVFKQGNYLTLGYVPRDEKGEFVDLTGKTLSVSIWNRKGVAYEGPATFSGSVLRFSLNKMIAAGEYAVEFTATSATAETYRKKFPTNLNSGRIIVKQSADDLGVVGIQVYTVAQLKAEQAMLQTKYENSINIKFQATDVKSTTALTKASTAESVALNVKSQFEQVVIEGDSSVEAAAARIAPDKTFASLKARLDEKELSAAARVEGIPVNIKTLGVKGDGVTDDTAAIQAAVNAYKDLEFPAGTYKITSPILIAKQGVSISGVGDHMDGSSVIQAVGCDGIFIRNNSRYVTISNLTIVQPIMGAATKGIAFGKINNTEVDNSVHYVNIENVRIDGFKTGISVGINRDETIAPAFVIWNVFFERIRIDHCENGLLTQAVAGSNFGLVFNKLYINNAQKALQLRATQAAFKDCNFGLNKTKTIDISTVSYITFDGCNFESDSKTTETSGNLFILNGKEQMFTNCTFLFMNPPGVYPVGVYSDLNSLIFTNCKYSTKSANEQTHFFSPTDCGCQDYAIKINGSKTLPRPQFPSAYVNKFMIDGVMPLIRDTSTQPVTNGVFNLNLNRNRPEFINGGVMMDFLGNPNLNTAYPVKIGGNFFIDGGTVTIPPWTDLLTINYNRKKAGIILLSETGSNEILRLDRVTTEAFYDKDDFAVFKVFRWNATEKSWISQNIQANTVQWVKLSQ